MFIPVWVRFPGSDALLNEDLLTSRGQSETIICARVCLSVRFTVDMKRRDLLKLGATAAAAPAAVPAQQQNPAVSGKTAAATNTEWKPSVFDNHQNQTVTVLAELIIPATDTPGAKAALVNRHIDHLLQDGSGKELEEFLEGLAWLDGYSIRKHQKPFVRCAPADQVAILETLDSGREPGAEPGHRFFQLAKRWTARIYYATQIGFTEMNKGGRVPSTFACKDAEDV